MTAKEDILAAIEEAAKEAAAFMTVDLRDHQTADGWHPDVVNATDVMFQDKKFSASIAPEVSDQAFIHEYGKEDAKPTATLRKYSQNDDAAQTALFTTLADKVSGLL
jgi:hypothetical protein